MPFAFFLLLTHTNTHKDRTLLLASIICQRQDHFSTIYNNISEISDASRKRRKLIEYCEKRPSQFQVLLEQIQMLNPEQYSLYNEHIFKL